MTLKLIPRVETKSVETIKLIERMFNIYNLNKDTCVMALRNIKSELSAKSYGEPVENFSKRRKTGTKAKSTETAKAGDEIQPSHLWQPLKLWKKHLIIGFLLV